MAEQYVDGVSRIFYRATGFRSGLNVTAKVFNSQFSEVVDKTLSESPDIQGIYYFDFNFAVGQYVIEFKENNVVKWNQVYNVVPKNNTNGRSLATGNDLINL